MSQRNSSRPPTETTLTINITHEMLTQAQSIFPQAVATCPTRLNESEYGYDVAADWGWAKAFVLQYKRPHRDTGRIQGFENYAGREGYNNYVKFTVDTQQWQTLCDYPEGVAFYALPIVCHRSEMPGNLDHDTLFIDVHGLNVDTPTRFYVPEDHSTMPLPRVFVRGSNGPDEIESRWIFYWNHLWDWILACRQGRLIRMSDDIISRGNDIGLKSPNVRIILIGGDDLPDGIKPDWTTAR